MAVYYVSSVDGDNASSGADWANAKATVAGALAVATSDGDIIKVDSAHSYTAGAAITWTPSANIHVSIISVNRSGGDAYLAGATESIGASNNAFTVGSTTECSLFLRGLTLNAATGGSYASGDLSLWNTNADVQCSVEAEDCTFNISNANTGALMYVLTGAGYEDRRGIFRNCTFAQLNATRASSVWLYVAHSVDYIGCTFTNAGTTPSALVATLQGYSTVRFVGCDFSGIAATNIVDHVSGNTGNPSIEFVNCKLNASTTYATTGGYSTYEPHTVTIINTDSGDTTTTWSHRHRSGNATANTSIYASSGAQVDANGLSWKVVTTATCDETDPLYLPWVAVWVDSTGSKTFSMELVYDSATNLQDDEVWMEVEALEDASYTLGTVTSTRGDYFGVDGSAADLAAGAATWTGTGGFTNENADKIAVTRTVAEKGLHRARLVVAKASQTLYVDPQLRVA